MSEDGRGTSGGEGGTSGARRRLALTLAAGFALILVAVMFANAESSLADLTAGGVAETKVHVWVWEVTSMIAWLSAMPAMWWAIARVRPPRFSWGVVVAIVVLGSVPVSLWHIGLMVALRKLYYFAEAGEYAFLRRFGDVMLQGVLYEYRKDAAAYLQFIAIGAVAQWLLARAGAGAGPETPRILLVPDGSVTHRVPVDAIDWAAAAGNYVELRWGGRTLLHRSTLAALADRLGPGFARIHRGRIVRRAAVQRVETDKSGDFTVTLAGGETLRGSRRYRADL